MYSLTQNNYISIDKDEKWGSNESQVASSE